MDKIINFVYDDWDINNLLPKGNGYKFCCQKNLTCCPECGEKFPNSPFEPSFNSMNSFQFKNFQNRRIEDVKKFPNEIFIYQIWYRMMLDRDFFNDGNLLITDEIIELLKTHSNLIILFLNEQEPQTKESLRLLDNLIKLKGINPNQIWYSNNNSRLSEYKEELQTEINVHTSRACSIACNFTLTRMVSPIEFKTNKEGEFFLCHNRTPKSHRIAFLSLLRNSRILENVDWSLIDEPSHDSFFYLYSHLLSVEDFNMLESDFEFFRGIHQKYSQYEIEHKWFNSEKYPIIPWGSVYESKTYENTYVNIVTESEFDTGMVHITEKSFKPFNFLQYPLIMASQHHIKFMKDAYDFDFFEDIINQDYDNEIDDKKRFMMFFNEIKRINSEKGFFIDFYANNKDRFIRNREKFISITNEYDSKFFYSLAKL